MTVNRLSELERVQSEIPGQKPDTAIDPPPKAADTRILSVLFGLTTVPVQANTLDEAAHRILGLLVQDLADVLNCSLLLYDETRQLLTLLAARGQADLFGTTDAPRNRNLTFRPGEGLAGLAFSTNEPYFWNHDSPDAHLLKRAAELSNPLSLAALPLSPLGRRLGILNLSFDRQKPFNHLRRRDLILLAGVVANALHSFLLRSEVDAYAATLENQVRVLEREIAERRKAEDARLHSEHRFRMVSDAVQDLIWTLDLATMRFTYLSPSALSLTGYTAQEALDWRLEEIFTPDSFQKVTKTLDAEITADETGLSDPHRRVELELEQIRKDGSTVHVGVTVSGLRDPQGRLQGLVGITRDITEHRRLQRQLRQAHKMEAVGTLAGGVAHDFNNILQVIAGCSDVIARQEELKPDTAKHLNHIKRATEKAADLVDHLLTFSRRVEPSLHPLDLNHQVREANTMISRLLPKMITVELDLSEDLATVNADPTQIEQILINLATNARDAMPDGGRLRVKTNNAVMDKQFCQRHLGSRPGNYACLMVSDNGQGMDAEVRSRIFEPFYTTKGVGVGTGLGLSVVYGIVKNHGGYVSCHSKPGEGTTFRIYLPAVAAKPSLKQKPRETPELQGGDEFILLVDDEPALLESGQESLERWGYRVDTCSSGEEAVAAAQEARPDLVILDLGMPGMGGEACLRQLLAMHPRSKSHHRHRLLTRCPGPPLPGGRGLRLPGQALRPAPVAATGQAGAGPVRLPPAPSRQPAGR